MVSSEKDPEKRKKIHGQVREMIMEIEEGKFNLMGMPADQVELHKKLVEKRQVVIEQLVDHTTSGDELNPEVLAPLEHQIGELDDEIAKHMQKWFLTHHFGDL